MRFSVMAVPMVIIVVMFLGRVGPLTLGVSYIDTDISKSESAYISGANGGFQSSKNGSQIAGSTVVFSLSAGF